MRISASCYALIGLYYVPPWGVNAGFIAGGEKTLIVDTGVNYLSAQTIFGYATEVKAGNTVLAINTEKHLDHLGGNCFFRDKGLDVYGDSKIARQEREIDGLIADFADHIVSPVRRRHGEAAILLKDTRIINPNKKIDQVVEFDLGDLAVTIFPTPGHTNTNLSIYVPAEGVLYCGDCIVSEFIPNLEEGSAPQWESWQKSLDTIEKLAPEIVIPGHGPILTGQQMLRTEILRMNAVLDEALKTGRAPTKED